MAFMEKLAVITPGEVTEDEVKTLDAFLDDWADSTETDRREGDLIEFLTHLSEELKQGNEVAIYASRGT